MRRSLIVPVRVFVAGVVGIDQVDVVDPSGQHPDEIDLARKDLLSALLPRADHADHLPMAGVVLQAEVRLVDRVVNPHARRSAC